MVQQQKSTTMPPFSPVPLTVIQKQGADITATNRPIKRAATKFKLVQPRLLALQKFYSSAVGYDSDSDDDVYINLNERFGRRGELEGDAVPIVPNGSR